MATVQPSAPTQQRTIRPLLFALLILSLLILATFVGRLRSLSVLDQQIAAAEISKEQVLARQQSLLDELARQRDKNAEGIDQTARRDLDLVKPGDFTFTVLPSAVQNLENEPQTSSGAAEQERLTTAKPIWKAWLELLIPE